MKTTIFSFKDVLLLAAISSCFLLSHPSTISAGEQTDFISYNLPSQKLYSSSLYLITDKTSPPVQNFNKIIASNEISQAIVANATPSAVLPLALTQAQCDRFKVLKNCCPTELMRPNCRAKPQPLNRCGVITVASNCCGVVGNGEESEFGPPTTEFAFGFPSSGGGIGGSGSSGGFETGTGGGSGGGSGGIGGTTGGTTSATTGSTTTPQGGTNRSTTPFNTTANTTTSTTITTTGNSTGNTTNIQVPEPGTVTILGGMMALCAYLKKRFYSGKKQ